MTAPCGKKQYFPLLLAVIFSACPSAPPAATTDVNQTAHSEIPEEPQTLIACVNKAAAELTAGIPQGSIVGVITIASADADEGELAGEQLILCLVQTGKFRIVERRDLDLIRREQNFQLSGDVDDETAVSIGRMAGAAVVITGTILPYGSLKYLNTKALDVETAQILTASSRPFSSFY